MVKMGLVEKAQIIIFGVILLITIFLILSPLILKKSGVLVASVSNDSPCKDIFFENSIITNVNGMKVRNVDDFYREIGAGQGKFNFIINSNPRVCEVGEGQSLGIDVVNSRSSMINFGIDVAGGKQVSLTPEGDYYSTETDDITGKITKRAEILGLTNFKIENGLPIELTYSPKEEVKKIISPGVTEFKIPQKVTVKNGTGEIKLGDNRYQFTLRNESVIFEGSKYDAGDSFPVEGIDFELESVSSNVTTFLMDVLDDNDITMVVTEERNGVFEQSNNVFAFIFQVELTADGSEKFEKCTKNQELILTSYGESMMKDTIVVSIDGENIANVPISGNDVGKKISRLNVFGFESDKKLAESKFSTLLAFLTTKRLPNLEITDSKSIPGNGDAIRYWVLGSLGMIALCSLLLSKGKIFRNAVLAAAVLITQGVIMLGFSFSKASLLIGITSATFFAILRSTESKNKISYISTALMFIVSFGILIAGLTVDSHFIAAFMVVIFLSSIRLIVPNLISKNEETFQKVDSYAMLAISLVLLYLFFFTKDLKVFSMVISSGLLLNLGFSEGIYEKFEKRT
jgi:hypothetical protein